MYKKLSFIVILIVFVVVVRKPVEKYRTMRFAGRLGSGINIGNSLDVSRMLRYRPDADIEDYETYWGNPPITRGNFEAIYNAGFKTVRIPVSWDEHMDEDGTVQEAFMDRVQDVADMALDCGLYVIIDTHHEAWLNLDLNEKERTLLRFSDVWEQIAVRFQDYDGERLLFEGMNEPRLLDSENEWNGGTPELRAFVNELNEAFVTAVRSTGGNNRDRYLLICPYCNTVDEQSFQELLVPDDERILVSVHLYQPSDFCHDLSSSGRWDPEEELDKMEEKFSLLYRYFISKGVPVVITEFGCVDKENTEDRISWTEDFIYFADKYRIPHMWWDNGSTFQLLDRETGDWVYPELVRILTKDGQ